MQRAITPLESRIQERCLWCGTKIKIVDGFYDALMSDENPAWFTCWSCHSVRQGKSIGGKTDG